jgi:hypothetical protein
MMRLLEEGDRDREAARPAGRQSIREQIRSMFPPP